MALTMVALPAWGALPTKILIVAGTDLPAFYAAEDLSVDLTNLHTEVTIVNTGVPANILGAGYKQIYDTRYGNNPNFSDAEETQYLVWLNSRPGNTLFLMGEDPSYNVRNAQVNAFVAFAGGGNIPLPAIGSSNLETVNPVFGSTPNAVNTVKYSVCGLVTSPGTGTFASSEAGGGCAIYWGTGALSNAPAAALVVVYDLNFIFSAPTYGALNEAAFRQNMEAWIAAPTVAPPVVVAPPSFTINWPGPIDLTIIPNETTTATGATIVSASSEAGWTASTTTPWITIASPSGTFPAILTATANSAGMATGTYTGTIMLTSTGGGTTQTMPVLVNLTVASPATPTASPTSLSMATLYQAGSATGYSIQVGASGMPFTVSTSNSSAGWLSISPVSGIAPAVITVTLDPSKALPGMYTDNIVISSPGVPSISVPVQLAISGTVASLPQQTNAATYAGPDHTLAPNEIATLFLLDFNCNTAPVVSLSNVPVTWSSYSNGQINFAVPEGLFQPASVSVACNGSTQWSYYGLNTAALIPGIFTVNRTGIGQAAATNGDGTSNSAANPASLGSVISVYGTGFGIYNPAGANGLRPVAGTVTATVGGVPATVLYAGSAIGQPDGMQQIDVQIPSGVAAGSAVPIVLTVSGTPTQTTATVALQ